MTYVLLLIGFMAVVALAYAGLMNVAGRLTGTWKQPPSKQATAHRDAALRAWTATAFPPVEWDEKRRQYMTLEERRAAARRGQR